MSLRVLLLRLFQTVFSTFKMFSFYGSPKSPFPPKKKCQFRSIYAFNSHQYHQIFATFFVCIESPDQPSELNGALPGKNKKDVR